ncbi:MAG: DinB family protein [Actinomycetota bacterium]|nr:DinB family protein [Actinomycetota bacterium]
MADDDAFSPVWPVARTTTIPRMGDERAMLVAYLDWYRETFELKCAGVEDRLSERGLAPSTMSLHGLLRHLAAVERWWFRINFAGERVPMLFYSDEHPDQDFEDLDGDVNEAFETWRSECALSRAIVDAAESLDVIGAGPGSPEPFTLRWLMLRMISEYAQHDGHADLLRQAIDGETGA